MKPNREESVTSTEVLDELRLNEARWRAILDTARDAIICIDRTGSITLFNRCAEEVFGYHAKEVLGENVSVLMPTPYRDEHDQYLRRYQQTGIAKAIGRIRSVEGRRRNGDVFPIELSVSETQVGDQPTYVAILRDVTERQSTEEALRSERDFAERLIETAQVIVLVLDVEGRIVRFNPTMERISGFRLDEVQGKDWFETFLPEAERIETRALFERALTRVVVRGHVNSILTRHGSERAIEWYANTLRDGNGQVVGVLSIGQDITDRRRADERRAAQYSVTAALASAGSLAAVTPRVLEAIARGIEYEVGELWLMDSESGVLRWAGTWHEPSPDLEEFEAASRGSTFPPGNGLPGRVWSRGHFEHVFDVTRDANFHRRPAAARLGFRSAIAFPVRSGGNVIAVMTFFSRSASSPDADLIRLLDSLGSQIGDFIERKRSDEAIRDSEARFFAFMNNSPAVAFMKDESGRYAYVNEPFARRFETTLAEVRGKTDFDLWAPELAQQLRANDLAVLSRNQVLEVLETVPTPDGEPHHWLVFKFPIVDGAGHRFLGGMAVDITERLRAEEQLREVQKLAQERERLADIGAITAKIAHDLGNPLGAISMQVQIMLRRARREGSAPVASLLDTVERLGAEVRRLEALIRDLMSFSRDQRLDLRTLILPKFLQEVVDLWQPLASEQGVTLTLQISDGVPAIALDEGKLRRVLDNLIKNALEALEPRAGRICLRVAASGGKVRISVEDSGPGIPQAVEVFRLFETTKPAGSGLGLAVARQLVQAHGGDITFAGVEPHGTVFHVDLPILESAAQPSIP